MVELREVTARLTARWHLDARRVDEALNVWL